MTRPAPAQVGQDPLAGWQRLGVPVSGQLENPLERAPHGWGAGGTPSAPAAPALATEAQTLLTAHLP